jgi:serine/threonine-protein kinase
MGQAEKSTLNNILKAAFIFLLALALLIAVTYFALRTIVRGRQVEVPNVVGKSFIEATEILAQKGLRTPQIEGRKYSANLPKDYIIEQRPAPKQKVKVGREIKVFLSLGTEAGKVPRIIGQTITEAESILNSAGLEVGTIAKVHSEDFPDEGTIIAHTPPPNATIQRGSQINILVSLGTYSRGIVVPNLGGMRLQDALEQIEFSGLKKGHISYKVSPTVEEVGIVLEQEPQPDSRVERGAVVDIVVSSVESSETSSTRVAKLTYTVPSKVDSSEEFIEEDDRHIKIVVEYEGITRTLENDFFSPGETLQHVFQIKGRGVAKIYVDDMEWPFETMLCEIGSNEFVSQ